MVNENENWISLLTASESELGSWGHWVTFVQNYKFDTTSHKLLSAAEILDLVSDHIDTTIIRGIEL